MKLARYILSLALCVQTSTLIGMEDRQQEAERVAHRLLETVSSEVRRPEFDFKSLNTEFQVDDWGCRAVPALNTPLAYDAMTKMPSIESANWHAGGAFVQLRMPTIDNPTPGMRTDTIISFDCRNTAHFVAEELKRKLEGILITPPQEIILPNEIILFDNVTSSEWRFLSATTSPISLKRGGDIKVELSTWQPTGMSVVLRIPSLDNPTPGMTTDTFVIYTSKK